MNQTILLMIAATLISAALVKLFVPAKHKRAFSWQRYLVFLLYPSVLVLILLSALGTRYAMVFVIGSLLGTIAEWLLGFYFRRIVGTDLWSYKQLPIGKYTSWLIMPLWGFCAVLFAFVAALIQ